MGNTQKFFANVEVAWDLSAFAPSRPTCELCATAVVRAISKGQIFLLTVWEQGRGWTIPGGHIEGEETPLDAALRELREETGMPPALVEKTAQFTGVYLARCVDGYDRTRVERTYLNYVVMYTLRDYAVPDKRLECCDDGSHLLRWMTKDEFSDESGVNKIQRDQMPWEAAFKI